MSFIKERIATSYRTAGDIIRNLPLRSFYSIDPLQLSLSLLVNNSFLSFRPPLSLAHVRIERRDAISSIDWIPLVLA